MLGKPSIFSKSYQKKKKKRKCICISLIGCITIFGAVGINRFSKREREEKEVSSNSKEEEIKAVKEERKQETKKTDEKKVNLVKTINLGNLVINMELDKNGLIESVNARGIMEIDISPDRKNIIISEKEAQKNIIVTKDGKITDISIDIYKSRKGNSFKKEDILKQYENYIWSKNAKFIDNENIVYITNRPYFSHNIKNQYIGITNISTLKNRILMDSKSIEIKLEERTSDGIRVSSSGKEYILNKLGNIID
ncbi:hypothetical protein [uncultured Clostridium sp.]|jgi:hypothetical protein|uniref:hypothetical protein n=1 Tax=uncultured Clostridium sp. TaxID=59620 RepID=UPI00260A9D3C|nr:hypothetical protein [uncultured Clostridium sp.]